ncbi:outer membrane beta-barrel protein [Flavobacterium terrigena]|nr:outer membrane beta-barrel protein [Flavobacterium terrigena]
MLKKEFSFLALFFILFSFSQKSTLKGVVIDEDKHPVQNSVVALLTEKDSVLHRFTRSDKDGNFQLKNITTKKYILMTFHNQYADYVDEVILKDGENNFGNISLLSKSKVIQEVLVKGKVGSIRIKGDTTSYKASDFKVGENANVEELLKKLPGIQVDKNGNIKAMGETVQKVLVDGEEFFGDDPGMAVKNLRADAVKEVQVFNKKSDQAEFTGIDDGNTQKTINLKLKEEAKKGFFGKIDAAGGPIKDIDSRYNSNVLLSSFKSKRKISAFLLNGNTGQDGLSWEDRDKYGDNDGMSVNMDDDGNMNYMWSGGNDDDEPFVDTQNGYIKNTNAGMQYSNKWNDKQTLNLSPKFNNQIYNNKRIRSNKRQIGASQLNENSETSSYVDRTNYKLNVSYDVKIDSMNTIKFSTKTNFYNTNSYDFTNGNTTDENGVLKNKSKVNLNTDSDKNALTANVLFKHKFAKARRTFSININWNKLNSNSNNYLLSDNESYTSGILTSNININQNKIGERTTQGLTTKFSYTEPLSKKFALEFGYQINLNSGINKQSTFEFNSTTDNYDVFVNSLSNNFKQKIITNRPSLKLSYNSKKINYGFGSGFGFTTFDLLDQTLNKQYNQSFTNFFPSANFTYKYKSNSSIRLSYNGFTTQPTIDQLQPVLNNQDFFNQVIGNPDLKQSFTNSFNLNQNSYNMMSEIYMYQGISFRTVTNQISNNRDINPDDAKTTTKAINTNGNYSGNYYLGLGFKIKKIDLNINVSPSINYRKSVISINNIENDTKNLGSSFDINFSRNKEKKYDISIGNRFSNNRNSTTINSEIKSFNTNNLSFNFSVYFTEKWKLSSDYNLFTRQKTEDFQNNLTNQLWNARFQRTFKNDEFTAYIMVRDILNQNIGIERYNNGNVISEEQNDRLKRYAMIGFTWNFKNKNEIKPQPEN